MRPAVLPALLLALAIPSPAADPAASPPPVARAGGTAELALGVNVRIGVIAGREVVLVVTPATGESWRDLARAYAASPSSAELLARLHGSKGERPDGDVRIPVALLSNGYRSVVLLNLFPDDRMEGGDWVHLARSGRLPTPDEGLWQVAEWFVGDGRRYPELAKANGLSSPELSQGQAVRIPASLLHGSLKPGPTSDDGAITYGHDERGAFGAYRLKPGEALYSAVVVRFTGRTDPDDVNAVAADLAKRSGIRDVTDIPVGFQVKIPLDLLEPEFLPRDHPRRRETDAAKKEMAEELARSPVRPARGALEGVLVIVDPGHGGRDLGTINHGVWEHDYVYDVACRLKAMIETETAARVFMTLEEPGTGFEPSTADRLVASRRGTLRTDPPFSAREEGESSVAVNLRWYLANSVLRKATAEGTAPDRVLFLSLHVDSRHPSLRGLMVYVPGQQFRRGVHGDRRAEYMRFQEVREAPTVQFARRELVRSEAVSRRLASDIVQAFRKEGLPVQPYKPVRDRVIRGRQTWLPAVLRGNAVPAKVLVEMVNLSNPQDAAILGAARDRDRLARALLRGISSYFAAAQSGSAGNAGSSP